VVVLLNKYSLDEHMNSGYPHLVPWGGIMSRGKLYFAISLVWLFSLAAMLALFVPP
jgi:hypothetical protein